MSKILYTIIESGSKKKVRIEDRGYGLEFFTMRNGWQWSGFGVDDELLSMMQKAIEEYFANIDNNTINSDGSKQCECEHSYQDIPTCVHCGHQL